MYNEEEKKWAELNSRFHSELHQLEQQIEELQERHDVLYNLLFNGAGLEEEQDPEPEVVDNTDSALVTFLANNPGSKRKDIDAALKKKGHTRYAVDKALKRLKAQGLISNVGSTQKTQWYATERK